MVATAGSHQCCRRDSMSPCPWPPRSVNAKAWESLWDHGSRCPGLLDVLLPVLCFRDPCLWLCLVGSWSSLSSLPHPGVTLGLQANSSLQHGASVPYRMSLGFLISQPETCVLTVLG